MERDYETYEDVCAHFRNFPLTWYPGLIGTLVEAAHSKKVFVDRHGASNLIKQIEDMMPEPLPAKEHRKQTIIAVSKAKKL